MTTFQLPDDLYPYQKEDLERLLSSTSNFLNLSEMGTGKTPVAIGLAMLGGYKKTLVVCPNSLQLEWRRQIRDWAGVEPEVSRKTSSWRRLQPLFADILGKSNGSPFFIINYESFRTLKHREVLKFYPFDLIILDEGHRLRNADTSQTRGMLDFLSSHPNSRLLVMTGSPIVNNPADLHTLLRMVNPERYGRFSKMEFINDYCYYWRTRYGIKVYGTKNLDVLRERTGAYTVRRTKKEVLPFLPDKFYRRTILEMEPEQRDVYDQMENELWVLLDNGEPLWAPNVLSLLTRLRQLNLEPAILGVPAPSVKTNFIKEILEDTDEKFVIFSCFEKYIKYLQYTLPYKHIAITGDVPVEERSELVRQFQEDDSVRLALGTTQCMGEGITLTAASNVIMTDRWWSPAVNLQAEDRLHRIGAKSAVQVILPVNEDSIDESLDGILAGKMKFSTEFLNEKDVMQETLEDRRRRKRSEGA